MIKRMAALTVALLSLGTAAQALEFQALGNGSLGVGGSGVARNFGAMAPYWNPAGLAFADKTVTVSLTVGAGVRPEGSLAQDLDNLNKASDAWDNAGQPFPSSQATDLINALTALNNTNSKDSIRLNLGAALGTQIKHVGFGVYGTFEGAAIPIPGAAFPPPQNAQDLNNILDSKEVRVRGIALAEVPLSYGYAFDLGRAGKLGVGGSVKYLNAELTDTTKSANTSSKDLVHDLNKDLQNSSSYGIDLGLLWKPYDTATIGLVAKNLNAPSFDVGTEKITVDRQVRAGFSWELLSGTEITGDIDVLPNDSIVPGTKTQHLGGGAEFHPYSCLKLRGGAYYDLKNAKSGVVTGGLSLGIPWLFFDLDGGYGLRKVQYDNKSYPNEAKIQFSTNLAF